MSPGMEDGRDLASLAVPATGELIAVNDRYEPFRMTGPDGATVEPVTEFFRDLLAAGRQPVDVGFPTLPPQRQPEITMPVPS
jgi:hypothetical protein